jgi:hypothetical protein
MNNARALGKSKFRSRFKLRAEGLTYLKGKGLEEVMQHARNFLTTRLFSAHPKNDGKQTPMRGHPVFIAQHATAAYCRKCVAKWYGIPMGCPLVKAEQNQLLSNIRIWLEKQDEEAGTFCSRQPEPQQQELLL